ncbi:MULTISPECIES: DUF4145 domain-containing protein [Pseudomonas]|uniref:DUF4145 domain-containing protein n=1 Tax=Pseudomonas TaxID=286 RepID=UPI002B4093BB|nr:DUF4145 domain-containing protein [Pseudomonas sichuanensis]
MDEGSIHRSHCNSCLQRNQHDVLKRHAVRDCDEQDEHFTETWTYTYTLLACRGCRTASLRVDYTDNLVGDYEPVFYPARVSRKPPPWRWQLKQDWKELLHEVYTALDADSRRLAVMGARTLVDLYLTEVVGNHGTFEQRLEKIVVAGELAPSDKGTLRAALEAGNAAAHRGYKPDTADLGIVMDVVEHLLQKHVLRGSAKNLEKSTPPRSKSIKPPPVDG